ncbi:hypothetical protein FOB33_29460 [Klebsiella variicola]|nr:hypothetical protein [Klebsiella variicola]
MGKTISRNEVITRSAQITNKVNLLWLKITLRLTLIYSSAVLRHRER